MSPSLSHPPSRHHSRRPTTSSSTTTTTSPPPPSSSSHETHDTSWLTRTASALAAHAMEEEGRSWLARRESATTSLSSSPPDMFSRAHHDKVGGLDVDMGRRRGDDAKTSSSSPRSSVPASRWGSRAGSKVDLLRMTSQLRLSSVGEMGLEKNQKKNQKMKNFESGVEAVVEPDFVDLDEEEEEEKEAGADEVDEGEMRRLVMGKVGGWVDWMVGWMDLRREGEDEEEEEEEEEERQERQEGMKETRRTRSRGFGQSEEMDMEAKVGIPAPGVGGLWEDTRWLMRVAVESV